MSSSHLEPVSLNDHHVQDVPVGDRKEVHVGNLGLGNALAVAYDIYGDTQLPATLSCNVSGQLQQQQQHQHPHVYSIPQFTGLLPLTNGVKTVGGMASSFQATAFHYRQNQQQYQHAQQQTPNFNRQDTITTTYPTSPGNATSSWGTLSVYPPAAVSVSSLVNVVANSYLTPIPSVPTASNPRHGSSHNNSSTESPMTPVSIVLAQSILTSTTPVTTTGSSSASPLPSAGMTGCSVPCTSTDHQQQPLLSSHYTPVVPHPIPVSSSVSMSSTSSTSSSCPSTASPPSSTTFLVETNGGQQQQPSLQLKQPHGYSVSQQSSDPTSTSPPAQGGSGGHQNATVEESLYEITDEELREIDTSLANSPDVMASRQWKYYIETNEWTRATCALMACLFTREQMANSTVLGRGGSQRARLPSNLVAYVVSTIRRRFNKPAAAVRARMAQKCKDERRFGRITVSTGLDGSPTPVAALTGKFSSAASPSSISTAAAASRRSRKRATTTSGGAARSGASQRHCYSPSLAVVGSEETGYQPTGALLSNGTTTPLDEDVSSQHSAGQLLPIPLSPSLSLVPEESTGELAQVLTFLPSSGLAGGRLSVSPVEPIPSVLSPLTLTPNPSSTVTG